jgi:hypothetical protein
MLLALAVDVAASRQGSEGTDFNTHLLIYRLVIRRPFSLYFSSTSAVRPILRKRGFVFAGE